jgi:septin family protein
MNTINLNFNLIDLDGTEIENSNIGKIIAQFLISETEGNALKLWDWSQKLYQGKPLELDESDQNDLKELIKKTNKLPIITKAQILKIITK